MSPTILPLPLIILQILTLSICITIEAIVLQQKLRLTRKQSIEFSISINLLSTIALWLIFFSFQALAPAREKLHLISIIFFNNFNNINRWTTVYPVLTIVLTMMFALIVFVEFRALQIFQALLRIFSETHEQTQSESLPLINRINTAILQANPNTFSTIFQANFFSNLIVALLIVFLNRYGRR